MPKLTRIIAPALIATMALGAAMPAQAYTPARAHAIRGEIVDLQRAVDRLDGRYRISEREAFALRRDVRQLNDQFRFFNRNGLSNAEYRALERRISAVRAKLRHERHDRNNRSARFERDYHRR